MEIFRVKVGVEGEIVLPLELRELLGLVAEDTLDLCIDSEGKIFVHTAERSVRPLSDFFEDLIISDLLADGCTGDCLKAQLLERKLKLSTILDRLSEEALRAHKNGQTIKWWKSQALSSLGLEQTAKGTYDVMLTTRSIHDIMVLQKEVLREIPIAFEALEQDPLEFKRLRGPYYETYRVSFRSGAKEYRVIYTVFSSLQLVAILTVGARELIYDMLNGIA